jgi:ABC-type branched-subunit amino acid transport system substrate-binding protein
MPLIRGRSPHSDGPPVRPRSWARRNPVAVTIPVVLLLAGLLTIVRPWERCGAGMIAVGSPYVCVGLNIDSGPMQADDPLADLEQRIADNNAGITGDFKTIVVLENLTVNPQKDSNPVSFIRAEIEGAITAAFRDDGSARIKLLLANFGSNAEKWQETVEAILDAAASQRIVAVTDVGLSQTTSRAAVAELSRHGMATIGATVTADNMNLDMDNARIKNFFRVGPTNTDEAHVAAKYIARRAFQRVMVVMDTTQGEDYSDTLSKAFQQQAKVARTKKYEVPKLTDVPRAKYMRQVFSGMHSDICSARPDVIYFAGRGADLGSFLEMLAADGACELASVTVLTGDDASTLAGKSIKDNQDIHFEVLYTAFAYPGQWQLLKEDPALKTHRQNYDDFLKRFTATQGFSTEDLRDGAAMIEHDAVAAAMRAALNDPSTEPQSIANFLANINCTAAVPGASGFVAFEEGTGNQVNKAIPIVRINADGSVTLADLDWSQRAPAASAPSC